MSIQFKYLILAAVGLLTACGGGSSGSFSPSSQLRGITFDSSASQLIVSDAGLSQIDRVDMTQGTLTQITGTTVSLNAPFSLTADSSGDLFVADSFNSLIREITAPTTSPVETTFSGVLNASNTYVNGCIAVTANPACTNSIATFNGPAGIAIDSNNYLYVVDQGNGAIRLLAPAASGGAVTTIAATGNSGFPSGNLLYGIAIDSSKNLYVSDAALHVIYKLTYNIGSSTWSAPTVFAGTSGSASYANLTGTSAQFNGPLGIVTDNTNLYVADSGNNAIRKIVISSGVVTTLAGGGPGTNGAAGTAGLVNTSGNTEFYAPLAIAYDGTQFLYAIDQNGKNIRKIDSGNNGGTAGVTSTLH